MRFPIDNYQVFHATGTCATPFKGFEFSTFLSRANYGLEPCNFDFAVCERFSIRGPISFPNYRETGNKYWPMIPASYEVGACLYAINLVKFNGN